MVDWLITVEIDNLALKATTFLRIGITFQQIRISSPQTIFHTYCILCNILHSLWNLKST